MDIEVVIAALGDHFAGDEAAIIDWNNTPCPLNRVRQAQPKLT